MPDHEPEVGRAIQEYLQEEGIQMVTGVRVERLARVGETRVVHGRVMGQQREYRADQVLLALGRQANTDRLGLEQVGVELTEGREGGRWQGGVKRNRFIKLTGATKSVNRQLEAKARALAGLKGYVTNLPEVTAEFVIDAYHRLFQIEKSFRMSKHDLRRGRSTITNAPRSTRT